MSARKKVVSTDRFTRPALLGPYSQGIVANGFLFTTGMTARNERGEVVAPGDIVEQTRQVLRNLQAITEAAGATMDDVVRMTVYLRAMEDALAVRDVRNEFWSTAPPVSTTIAVADLVRPEVRIEIDAIVVVPPA